MIHKNVVESNLMMISSENSMVQSIKSTFSSVTGFFNKPKEKIKKRKTEREREIMRLLNKFKNFLFNLIFETVLSLDNSKEIDQNFIENIIISNLINKSIVDYSSKYFRCRSKFIT